MMFPGCEGLLKSADRPGHSYDDCVREIYCAYLRWLETQGFRPAYPSDEARGGHLITVATLHERRGPGGTCLSALNSGHMGTVNHPLNHSKGCGGIMRAAPAGLTSWQPFCLGVDLAAITHGHPSGYLSAGCLAKLIAELLAGNDLQSGIAAMIDELRTWPHCEECLGVVKSALNLAKTASATPETIERIGGGWVGEEALAIALSCALKAQDFRSGVLLAANHSGDSDSTAAITGNILGTLWGEEGIPPTWLERLELHDEIVRLV